MVGRFHGMLYLSTKHSRSIVWCENSIRKTFWRTIWRTNHSVWLSITPFLRKNSQESINLERKSYLDCSLDAFCTREEFGRETSWLQTLRSWKRWTHQKSTLKDSMRRKQYFPPKKRNIYFSSRRWTNQICWRRSGTENIHLDPGSPNSRRKLKGFSWRIRRASSSTTSGLPSGCRWSDKWLLVHVRKLHITPSRRTQSQTLLTERRIIPYSTETYWRLQNHKNKFGCYTRTSHRWLLVSRWIKRCVWLLDRFHSVYSIRWETSRRMYVVRGETDKTPSDFQARSFMSRTLDEIGKKC